jgi:hypothetical protein
MLLTNVSIVLTELVYLQKMDKSLMDQWYFRTHCIPIMGFSLIFPSRAIDTFVPTSMFYKISTNNQTFINIKESYVSPNSSTKIINNKIIS